MAHSGDEGKLLHSVVLQDAGGIGQVRPHAEEELTKAKEELARSLAMMRATLESTSDGILVTDAEQRVTGYNRRYMEMWGIPAGVLDAPGYRHPGDASRHFKDPGQFLARLDAIYATAPQESQDVLELADGRVYEQISRIQYLDGRDVGRVWSFRDISERRRADEAQVMLAAIVESSDDAIVSKDLNGIIRSWNRGAERVFGYTREEAVGRSITLIIPPELIAEEHLILGRLRRGERIEHFETIRLSKTGRRIDISLTISPVRNSEGQVIGVSKIARDITERRHAQEALREADRRKDEFLALLADYAAGSRSPQGRIPRAARP